MRAESGLIHHSTSVLTACEAILSDSDQQLIDQFRESGRQECMDELLHRHLASVRAIVFQMLLNNDAADDVTQDVFLRVVKGIDRFEGRSEFSTWLFQVAMNTVRSYLQKQQRLCDHGREELHEYLTVSQDTADGPVLQAELATNIQTALLQLTPQLRAAIVLVCLQGKTATEASEIENCSTNTMYWRVHEGRRKLEQLLSEHLS
jgi:RNA polymerase sigma-70 factor, ECF subfamily